MRKATFTATLMQGLCQPRTDIDAAMSVSRRDT